MDEGQERTAETRVLSRRRGGAEEIRAVGFGGFSMAPWLRESAGSLSQTQTRISREGAKTPRKTLERGFLRIFAALREKSCPCVAKPRSLTGTRRHQEGGSNFHRGFSASQRLRENIRFFRPKLLFSRGDAEARRKSGLSASAVSPWLRGSVRALAVCPKPKPGSLAKARRRQERRWNGVFFAPSRLCERNHAFCVAKPNLSRGHGDTGKAEAIISIDVSPRLRASARTFGFFRPKPLALSRRR
jgi:hypothetical protein